VLPGFDHVPLYDVSLFFFKGLTEGYLATRAAAISFSLFLAIFPFLIFLFTIIPFIPIDNFQTTLLRLIADFLPAYAYETVKDTIIDIVTRPRSSLLILNLLLTLYFSTNGVDSLMVAFNDTYHVMETRTTIKRYLVSIFLVLFISFLLIISIGLITFGSGLLKFLLPDTITGGEFFVILLQVLRWLIILALLLTAISSVYYLAPARRGEFRFISAGSLLATLLVVVTTLGFNFYVDNFASYNALYGSLGTLMVVLVWIYINAISLLIGFELNASIRSAGSSKRADLLR
jgi:membrane protein